MNEQATPETAPQRAGMSIIVFAGLMSIAAGAVHAAAAGIHVETKQLAQIFVITAVLQIGVGIWAVLRPGRLAASAVVVVSVGAFAGWLTTRLAGISWIDGLEVREAPGFADTACAALAVVAAIAGYTGAILPADRRRHRGLAIPAALIGLFAVWTMLAAGTTAHTHADGGHSHGDEAAAAATGTAGAVTADDGHAHDDTATTGTTSTDTHSHDETATDMTATDDMAAADGHAHDATAEPVALAWPRPWDPAGPIDLSGVDGVTIEQEVRASELVAKTLVELQKFADPAAAIAAGYISIGDAGTGQRALHQGLAHRGRRPARPCRTRVARVRRRRRTAHARRRHVHRQCPPRRRPVAHRLGRPADDLAQARQPLLVDR